MKHGTEQCQTLKARVAKLRPMIYSQGINSSSPLIPVNLPAVTKPAGTPWMLTSLPSLGQGTLSSNTVHTTYGISSILPAPLTTIPDLNWIKGYHCTKKNNKPMKLLVLKKKYQYYLSFSELFPGEQDSGKQCEFWCYPLYDARLMQLCLVSISLPIMDCPNTQSYSAEVLQKFSNTLNFLWEIALLIVPHRSVDLQQYHSNSPPLLNLALTQHPSNHMWQV